LYSVVKVLQLARLAIQYRIGIFSFVPFGFTQNLVSATISMLYKRAFRKEKEVTTFLIKVLKLNWAINVKAQRRQVPQAVCQPPLKERTRASNHPKKDNERTLCRG